MTDTKLSCSPGFLLGSRSTIMRSQPSFSQHAHMLSDAGQTLILTCPTQKSCLREILKSAEWNATAIPNVARKSPHESESTTTAQTPCGGLWIRRPGSATCLRTVTPRQAIGSVCIGMPLRISTEIYGSTQRCSQRGIARQVPRPTHRQSRQRTYSDRGYVTNTNPTSDQGQTAASHEVYFFTHIYFMEGTLKAIGTFNDGPAKSVVTEDVFKPSCDTDWFITHEIALTVGSSSPLILRASEVDSVIAVLQKAKDLAGDRVQRFYLDDEVSALCQA